MRAPCIFCGSPVPPRKTMRGVAPKYCSRNCIKRAWKTRNRDHARADYLKNIERYRKNSREWGRVNAKRKQARNRADYARNPERVGGYFRKWKRNNPEKMQTARERWLLNNLDRFKATAAAYRKAHPEKIRQILQRRRARVKAAVIGPSRPIEKWEASWRNRKTVSCYWCTSRANPSGYHADHIVAIANGGAHAIENLCISCRRCNQRKSAKEMAVWNRSLLQPVLI